EKINDEVFIISAYNKKGINELLDKVVLELNNIPPLIKEEEKHTLYELKEDNINIEIIYEGGIYYVLGEIVELYYNRVNFSEEEGVRRFTQQLRTLGVEDMLREKGISNGDTVNVYGFEFEFLE
ncbi:MAG TPA: Obg family GTPase CgtA, partial [Acholeplasma sp.]|nr:Obg family GTPase CgtA [Acholeplasma sp.]